MCGPQEVAMAFLLKSRWSRALAIAAVVALPVLWWATAYPRGVLMAHFDHARGRYEVQTYGEGPPPWRGEYGRLLKERYGIRLNHVASRDVSPWVRAYADGYNSVSMSLLEEKYGEDVFRECTDEARQRWLAEHPQH
jgi:hypothetical protein